jgi:hypothetical protein
MYQTFVAKVRGCEWDIDVIEEVKARIDTQNKYTSPFLCPPITAAPI